MHAKAYLISCCALLLLGAFAVSTVVFAHPSHTDAAAPPIIVGLTHGCPSTSVGSQSATPKVIVTPQDVNHTITAHTGDLIAFQFPFGQSWSGPTTSQGHLALLPPAGYADPQAQVCVWRFVARSTGVTHLDFFEGPLCQLGQVCPYFVVLFSFTVAIK